MRSALAVFGLTGILGITACGSESSTPPPRLHTNGTRILDGNGNEVVLRGVNLGGWMFHETWITLVGHSLNSRILVLAKEADLNIEVEQRVRIQQLVCQQHLIAVRNAHLHMPKAHGFQRSDWNAV